LGLAIVAVLGLGFGLLFSAVNVFFRDFGQVVDILTIVIPWSVPMIYPWTAVQEAAGNGLGLQLYLANPLATSTLLFQRAFWWPADPHRAAAPDGTPLFPDGRHAFPDHLTLRGLASLLVALVLLGIAQLAFARLQRRFAQEL
jgi:ABC-2 type transport system permease protein